MTEEKVLELTHELMGKTLDLLQKNDCTPAEGMGIVMSSTLTIAGKVAELTGEDPQMFQRKMLQDTLAQL